MGTLFSVALGLYLLFAADSAGWVLGARIIQGLSTGMATSALGAWLVDLDRERGALVNAVAPMVGLAVGAMGTSALMELGLR